MLEHSIAAKGIGEKALIKVPSASKPGVVHFVDPEREMCSCVGFAAHQHCYHVELVRCAYCQGYGTLISYPRLVECPSCSGSGRAS